MEYEQDPKCEVDPRTASMIVKYLSADSPPTGGGRKVVHAVFADGTPRNTAVFPEVWKNETKERKNASGETRRPSLKVDVEEGNYGDYDASESSELEKPLPDCPPSPNSPPPEQVIDVTAPLGGNHALSLRLRLLSLLSTVSAILPQNLLPLTALYGLCIEQIRPLPLSTFFIFMSSSLTFLTAPAPSTLTQYILRSLIASAAPRANMHLLAQDVTERCYLPFTAHTQSVGDNARVSLLIETLLRLLDRHVGLEWRESLVEATERGIEAREMKAKREGRKVKRNGQAGGERMWLTASAERIRGVVKTSKPS